jgi:hypothetical protein
MSEGLLGPGGVIFAPQKARPRSMAAFNPLSFIWIWLSGSFKSLSIRRCAPKSYKAAPR